MNDNDPVPTSSSVNLEYMTQESQNNLGNKTADFTLNMRIQGILTVQPALNKPTSKNMFNVQLNYDSN